QDPDGPQHRLSDVWRVRSGGERLVPQHRYVRRRSGRRAFALDRPQRSRHATHLAYRPSSARGWLTYHWLVDQLWAWLAERQPARVCRPRRTDRRLLWRLLDPRRRLPRP